MNLEERLDQFAFFTITKRIGLPCFFLEGFTPVRKELFYSRVGLFLLRSTNILFLLNFFDCVLLLCVCRTVCCAVCCVVFFFHSLIFLIITNSYCQKSIVLFIVLFIV